eukprot:317730-Amphidinium_carterae.1
MICAKLKNKTNKRRLQQWFIKTWGRVPVPLAFELVVKQSNIAPHTFLREISFHHPAAIFCWIDSH